MRFILLILFSGFYLSASAQWYRIDLKLRKKIERPASIEVIPPHFIARLPHHPVKMLLTNIEKKAFNRSEFSYQAMEASVMKTAQHNMRFRVYNDASYNFSELARLYIQQNRYAEAKWYLLQSNSISRNVNDDRHTIANLIDLATVKAGLGDYIQAQQDLNEALEMANIRGYKDDVAAVNKEILLVKRSSLNPVKVDVRYAEAPSTNTKAE